MTEEKFEEREIESDTDAEDATPVEGDEAPPDVRETPVEDDPSKEQEAPTTEE